MTATPKAATIVDPHSCRFLIRPRDGVASVQIGRTAYIVREGGGSSGERYWTFLRGGKDAAGVMWTVHVRGRETMWCNCPDQMFRRRTCKHRRCVETLYGVPQVPPPPGGYY